MALGALETAALERAVMSSSFAAQIAAILSGGDPAVTANTAITTVGAGTLTAASIAGGIITRSGSTAAYTDTTATAALVYAAIGSSESSLGQSWYVTIKNTVGFPQTITGGNGVTVSGVSIVPAFSATTFLFTMVTTTTATMVGLYSASLTALAPEVNTAISTVGAGTLTAAGIVGRLITRSGSTAAYTDTTATAAQIIAAMPNANIGDSFEFSIKNTVGFSETLAAGASVTLAGLTIVPPFSVGRFLCVVTAAATATITGISSTPLTAMVPESNTAISTVGAGTLTAAGIAGRLITRTGSTADYTDTTDTAAAIIAAMPNANVGDAFEFTIKNMVAFSETLAAGASVTLAGLSVVPPLSVGRFLCVVTASTTVTITGIETKPLCNLPYSKFTTIATDTTITAAAGTLTGAAHVVYQTTAVGAGGIALTTRTATEMFGDTPNAQIGMSFLLTLVSQGGGTVTLTAGANVTITGTATVATKTTRTFVCTFTSATALTVQSVSTGAIE